MEYIFIIYAITLGLLLGFVINVLYEIFRKK